jgi:hypothetical protein
MRSPRRSRDRIMFSSARRSSGISLSTLWPIISSAV